MRRGEVDLLGSLSYVYIDEIVCMTQVFVCFLVSLGNRLVARLIDSKMEGVVNESSN